MVQAPETAQYRRMPESAAATGLADYILPAEQMPEALVKYVRHGSANVSRALAAVDEAQDSLNQLLALLRVRSKLDFRRYRKKMLARRLERRMALSHFENFAEYLAHLRENPEEIKRLARDLLISVTGFFRDTDAFGKLETDVIAPLVQAKDADIPVRVWVPGCATGEEAYSIAMLLLEHQTTAQSFSRLQVFATDVDDQALDVARRGTYPEGISADVSPERLVRFFTHVDDSGWQVSKILRETVTFARQNLITDAPFSKMDLISCRNILIYLEPDVQAQILSLLHFALKEGGCLFLGPSETVGRKTDLFEPISNKWRIFRRIGPGWAHDLRFPVIQTEPRQAKPQSVSQTQVSPRLADLAQNTLLRRFGLACVVINRDYEVLHFAGSTEEYLAQPGGPPTQDLLSLARRGLEPKLRVVIRRAIRENAAQSIKGVIMRHDREIRRVDIDVEPLSPSRQNAGLLLVSFQEQSDKAQETAAGPNTRTERAESGRCASSSGSSMPREMTCKAPSRRWRAPTRNSKRRTKKSCR